MSNTLYTVLTADLQADVNFRSVVGHSQSLAIIHTRRNLYFDHLCLCGGATPSTLSARCIDDLSLPMTASTRGPHVEKASIDGLLDQHGGGDVRILYKGGQCLCKLWRGT